VSDGTPGAGPAPEEPEPTLRLPAGAGTGTAEAEPGQGAVRRLPEPGEPSAVKARRFWSSRRIPSAVTAAAVLALSGLFLYDVASVRAGRKAMYWRTRLARELATRHLDDVWIILGASVSAALGLWLIVLALTPGERAVLPMARRAPASVRAGLDRHAAELVLRDRAMEVSGIRWARAVVGRRRIRVRATAHFRDLEDVRRDLTAAVEEAVRQLGLARAPHLTVHLQRAEKGA
jgi:hypothetical protein